MEETENQKPGDAGNKGEVTPTPTPTTPKVEIKDGATFVDGKKMVAESDLIAAKRSLESTAEKAQAAHNEAIDAKSLELASAQQSAADLNAKLTEAKNAQGQGATTDEEVARVKQEREDALLKVETLTTEAGKALELKRALLILKYSVSAESLENKTMQELDSFEEAAKALSVSRGSGPGPYAIGAGAGGVAPMTEMERAAKVIESTPIRGAREPAPQK